jgi:hypothetical protein
VKPLEIISVSCKSSYIKKQIDLSLGLGLSENFDVEETLESARVYVNEEKMWEQGFKLIYQF